MTDETSFRFTQDTVGISMLVFTILYYFICDGKAAFETLDYNRDELDDYMNTYRSTGRTPRPENYQKYKIVKENDNQISDSDEEAGDDKETTHIM